MDDFHYPRPALAHEYVQKIMGHHPLSDAPNGLFLAAPRRTGKSEFLKKDLRLALQDAGLVVLYADLWKDYQKTPQQVVSESIKEAFFAAQGTVAKAASKSGLKEISLAGIKIDTSKIGLPDGLSLYDALNSLHKSTGKRIALMVDEAQHALTSEEGEGTMRALKSARDQMRESSGNNLLLVMTGSHREKLMRLVNSTFAPFWGSQVESLPLLGRDYIQHLRRRLVMSDARFKALEADAMVAAFEHCGCRPQFFIQQLGSAVAQIKDWSGLGKAVQAVVSRAQQADRDNMSEQYRALKPEEQLVLWRLLEMNTSFKAFDANAMAFYQKHLDPIGKKITPTQVQRVLEKLRSGSLEQSPLVWSSARGDYSVYDQAMQAWFDFLKNAGQWPPKVS